jgi:thioredoxin 1
MTSQSKSQVLTQDNFNEKVLESARPVLVDFWADWCAPCHRVAPVVERVAESFEERLTVGKVDVDQNPELAGTYGIRSIPALLVFRDGEVVEQLAGAVPFEQLSASVERALSAD